MSDRRPASGTTLHLVPEPRWTECAGQSSYEPEAFAADGFIHTTYGEDRVIEIANMFYTADPRPYLLLAIDLARVAAPAVIEDPDGHFPHIYGPLNLDAVTGVRRVTRDDSGRFLGVGSAL